jgi:hypothetical protein
MIIAVADEYGTNFDDDFRLYDEERRRAHHHTAAGCQWDGEAHRETLRDA